jgi:hypothetical protein
MKKILLAVAAVAIVSLSVWAGDVRQYSTAVTCKTNAVLTSSGTLAANGLAYRIGITVAGGTSDVSVADSDGTVLAATNTWTGSILITPTTPVAYSGVTVKTANANTSNVTATVTITTLK